MSLRVLYCRHNSVSSQLIRAGSWWAPWSHAAVIDGDTVIQSLALQGGVVRSALADVIAGASHYEIVEVECPNPERGLAWCRSSIGLPYDWTGVLAIPFREREWQDPHAWYCSENVEQTIVDAERVRFRDGLPGIDPNRSYYAR